MIPNGSVIVDHDEDGDKGHTVFGWVWLPRDSCGVAVLAIMLGLAAVGLLLFGRRFRTLRYPGWGAYLNACPVCTYSVSPATGIAWLRITKELAGAGHARHIYPAGVGLSLLTILGWEGLVGPRRARLIALLFLAVQAVEAILRLQAYHQT